MKSQYDMFYSVEDVDALKRRAFWSGMIFGTPTGALILWLGTLVS